MRRLPTLTGFVKKSTRSTVYLLFECTLLRNCFDNLEISQEHIIKQMRIPIYDTLLTEYIDSLSLAAVMSYPFENFPGSTNDGMDVEYTTRTMFHVNYLTRQTTE